MIENVKDYIEPFIVLDEPIPYKELFIYPFKVKDYYTFISTVDILTIEKNKIPDIRIIQMNYLQYLTTELFMSEEDFNGKPKGLLWQYKFYSLLCGVFKVEAKDIMLLIDENDKIFVKIKDTILNSKEFDEVRKIILFQNIHDFDDTDMSSDFKKAVEEYYKIKNKDIIAPDLRKKISVIISVCGISKNELKEMTLLSFEDLFKDCVDKIEYQINKIAESNGCKFEKPIEHWVYIKNKNKYEEAFADYDGFKKKIESANG